MFFQRSSRVRGRSFRKACLSLANACPVGSSGAEGREEQQAGACASDRRAHRFGIVAATAANYRASDVSRVCPIAASPRICAKTQTFLLALGQMTSVQMCPAALK